MASRPIPQQRPGPGQGSSSKNPPLATSLDIEFSYRQPPLAPGERQVVGSNPSFLAFTDDERPLNHSSPYAFDEEDESEGGGGKRRGSDDWWSGSEAGLSQSEEEEDDDGGGDGNPSQPGHDEPGRTGAQALDESEVDDGETPRPAFSTLPSTTLPASLSRYQHGALPVDSSSPGFPPLSSLPSSTAGAAPRPPPLRSILQGSYGFPSASSLPRTSPTEPMPPVISSASGLQGPAKAERSPRRPPMSLFDPLFALVGRRSSVATSSGKDENEPLLPRTKPMRLGCSDSRAVAAGPSVLHSPSSISTLPSDSPHAAGSRGTFHKPSHHVRKRRLIFAYLMAGLVLVLVAFGAGFAGRLLAR